MKSPIIWKWCTVLSLTFLPFAGGCLRAGSETNLGGSELQLTNSMTSTNADAAALEAAATNAPAIDISEAEVTPIEMEPVLPSSVRAQGPAGDLLKLANSGVEDNVLLAFVTNSASVFDLSADEIIYLNDLGISGAVVTATMHRDQVLKAAGVASAPLQPSAASEYPPQDAGITTNWIGAAHQQSFPEQPDPSQVAPQSTVPPPPDQGPQAQQAPVTVAPPQVEVTYSTFYSSLSPYGRWLEVDGYGRVWQPTVVAVNANWSPYFDSGRWVYTDLGWYWSSDYSWGWAPFHYGRWFRHQRVGWCWTPDLVWGPSWVTWRYNDAYCGWAPLPPAAYYRPGFGFSYYGSSVSVGFGFGLSHHHYSFVHWDRFRHHHRNHLHAVPIHRRPDVYHNTKPVTRIVSKNNHIINEGPSAQRVAAATRTALKPVKVRETRSRDFVAGGRTERLDPAKRTLTVYKPETPKGEVGGIPMERVKNDPTRATSRTSTAAVRGSAGFGQASDRTRPSGTTPGGVESRFTRSDRSAPASTTPSSGPAAGRTENVGGASKPVARPDLDRSKGSRTVESRPGSRSATTPAPVANAPSDARKTGDASKPAGASTAIAEKRPETAAPTQRSVWTSPRSAENRGGPDRPSTSASPSPAQQRQSVAVAPPQNSQPPARVETSRSEPSRPTPAPAPSVSRGNSASIPSPKVTESPARTERRTFAPSTPSPAPSRAAPSTPARQPSIWSSPRASSSRSAASSESQMRAAPSAPSRQYSGPSPAPSASISRPSITTPRQQTAPVQRQYSAPTPQPRQYSAPAPAPRQYSAPQAVSPRSYSPPQSVSPAPRSYSAPQSAPRSYSPPQSSGARSSGPTPSPSYSAPSGGSQRSYSPATSSSRGGSSGGGRSRSER